LILPATSVIAADIAINLVAVCAISTGARGAFDA
jgi:hypothetical protein